MYLFHLHQHSLFVAQLTEGVCLYIAVTDAFPRSSVPLACSRVTAVLLVTLVLFLLVQFAETTLRQIRTAGMVARVFSLSWHRQFNTSYLEIPKKNGKRELAAPMVLLVLFLLFASLSYLLIIYYHIYNHCI